MPRVDVEYVPGQIQARHGRQADVGNDDVEGAFVEFLERFLRRAPGATIWRSSLQQQLRRDFAHDGIVLDIEDSKRRAAWFWSDHWGA